MRLSRLPAALVAAVLFAGTASCATTIDGTGTLAADVPTGTAAAPTGSSAPEPSSAAPAPDPATASPTSDPLVVKERLLCVLERSAIASINRRFNDSKNRAAQLTILRSGATTIKGHLTRSGLPSGDKVRHSGQGVLDQLTRLVSAANAGGSPSTKPYNSATESFQKVCNALS